MQQIKQTTLNPIYLFISPPSLSALRDRLMGRGTETDASVQKRLDAASREIEYAKAGAHDLVIVNDDLDRAYAIFEKVALGETTTPSDTLPDLE